MLHPHPISLVSWSSCSQSLEHDPASVTNLNDAICNICCPGNEAVHVHYVTLYKHHVVWCGVVWCGVVWCGVMWCASTPLFVHGRVNIEHVDTGQRGMWFDQCSYWRVFTTHFKS